MAACVVKAEETELFCASCSETFTVEDEVIRTRICFSVREGNQLQRVVVLDDHGDLRFSPEFLHTGCWEDLSEELSESLKDVLPDENEQGVICCAFCSSDILPWEYFSFNQVGMFFRSPRSPEGHRIHRFGHTSEQGSVMCLACISRVHEEVLEIWEEVSQEGECHECTYARCWRDSSCTCICHSNDDD